MSRPANFAFHAGSPSGDEGYVVQMEPVDAAGRVRVREWPKDAYDSPARESVCDAAELEERFLRWQRGGWTFTESIHTVLGWLRWRE